MPRYEYKVVPAPNRAAKVRGVKGTDARFAASLAQVMNDLGAEGWEYQRTDTLPCEERTGLTGKTTTFQNMLVFRRALETKPAAAAAPAPVAVEVEKSEPVLAVPSFRSTARAPALSTEVPQGKTPRLTAAKPEPAADAPPVGAPQERAE